MSAIIGNLARQAVIRAKRIPVLRRLLSTPWAAPLMATAAKWFPPADPAYAQWIAQRIHDRREQYPPLAEPGLLSLITPVWNTPPDFLRTLAASVLGQIGNPAFEWVVLDNGTTQPETRALLQQLADSDPRIRLYRSETNGGIIAGMRFCLEQASGRYVVAIDHDDRLDLDAVAVLTHHIRRHQYPPSLYSDEDHLCGQNRLLPYFKPDWDPVLFLNSAYTAHVGVMDRQLALKLDVYGDRATNSCPDWDAFLRFYTAGYEPVHVPEILYSWRMHPGSTSANMHSKRDVDDSHRAMLQRYCMSLPNSSHFEIVRSPLFGPTPDWWIRRRHTAPRPMLLIVVTNDRQSPPHVTADVAGDYPCTDIIAIPRMAHPALLQDRIAEIAAEDGLVALLDDLLQIEGDEWAWEALGLIERHAEVVTVGGRILDRQRRVVDAGRVFEGRHEAVCPDVGRTADDPGSFHQMWKQRSVDAVSPLLAVHRAEFLSGLLARMEQPQLTLDDLGLIAARHARSQGQRVVYSPFLSATAPMEAFALRNDSPQTGLRIARPQPHSAIDGLTSRGRP